MLIRLIVQQPQVHPVGDPILMSGVVSHSNPRASYEQIDLELNNHQVNQHCTGGNVVDMLSRMGIGAGFLRNKISIGNAVTQRAFRARSTVLAGIGLCHIGNMGVPPRDYFLVGIPNNQLQPVAIRLQANQGSCDRLYPNAIDEIRTNPLAQAADTTIYWFIVGRPLQLAPGSYLGGSGKGKTSMAKLKGESVSFGAATQ